MIERFSGGYYRMRMSVQSLESGPKIERELYDFIDRELYFTTSMPVTMKVGLDTSEYFHPRPEGAMPQDVLGLPRDMMERLGMEKIEDGTDVYIVHPDYASTFNQQGPLYRREHFDIPGRREIW